MDNWRQFKFTFLGYTGTVNARLKQAMIESEVMQEAAIMNSVLPVGDQQASTQLCYMLVLLLEASAQRLLEYAGDGEGLLSWHRLVQNTSRQQLVEKTSLLFEVLAQTFKGDVRGSLDEFEVKIRKYERSCREVLSDRLKIAVVQKGHEDDDLRRHLLMHASRHSTYPLEEFRSIIMARYTLTGPGHQWTSALFTRARQRQEQGQGSHDEP